MRFYNYLNEYFYIENPKVISELKKCKPFINDLLKCKPFSLLYSGRRTSENWFVKNVRKDRKPRDMKIEIHNILDEVFYEKFGIKARSQTIFTTPNYNQTKTYTGTAGSAYIIFPMGEYEIIWSDRIYDLYGEIVGMYSKTKKDFSEFVGEYYQKGNLCNAIRSKTEIMLYCNRYVAIKASREFEYAGSQAMEEIKNLLGDL